jgi:hypothetical protein
LRFFGVGIGIEKAGLQFDSDPIPTSTPIYFVLRIAIILALASGILWAWIGFRSVAASLLPSYMHLPQSILLSTAALATCVITLLFTKLVQPMLIEE